MLRALVVLVERHAARPHDADLEAPLRLLDQRLEFLQAILRRGEIRRARDGGDIGGEQSRQAEGGLAKRNPPIPFPIVCDSKRRNTLRYCALRLRPTPRASSALR